MHKRNCAEVRISPSGMAPPANEDGTNEESDERPAPGNSDGDKPSGKTKPSGGKTKTGKRSKKKKTKIVKKKKISREQHKTHDRIVHIL